jgi:hypothetical protein
VNLRGTARQYFHISKLETVVKIFDSVDEAVASFASDKSGSHSQAEGGAGGH